MPLEIHPSTIETLYFPVRSEHPTAGPNTLNLMQVEVAMPLVGAAPSVWVAGSWSSGSRRYGADRYAIASILTSAVTISSGNTYQPWLRLGGVSGAIVKVNGTIKVANT